MLVDTHCHIMPDRLASAIRRFLDQHMGWGKLAYAGVLHERLMFGSNCPNTSCTIAESSHGIRQLGLSDRALRAILGENAVRLVP